MQVPSLSREDPWRREWQPLPVVLPGESMDRGAWWATVHGLSGHLASSQLWALLNNPFSQSKTHQEGGNKHKHGESFNKYKGIELKENFPSAHVFLFWFVLVSFGLGLYIFFVPPLVAV